MLILSLGSNEGQELENLTLAIRRLKQKVFIGPITCSSVYKTPPWGKTDQKPFLNMVVGGSSNQIAHEVLLNVLLIEKEMGRQRIERWGPRLIDIDLLFLGSQVIKTDDLTLPHPYVDQRWFVLKPLMDVAPDFRHPILLKSIKEIADTCVPEKFEVVLEPNEILKLLDV